MFTARYELNLQMRFRSFLVFKGLVLFWYTQQRIILSSKLTSTRSSLSFSVIIPVPVKDYLENKPISVFGTCVLLLLTDCI